MTLDDLRTTQRERILICAGRRGAHNVRVFGSVARGESDARSDIDLLPISNRAEAFWNSFACSGNWRPCSPGKWT